MSDISTKKTIEVWDGDLFWVIKPSDSFVKLEYGHNLGEYLVFSPESIGPLCRALHEVAQNVLENTRDDDE